LKQDLSKPFTFLMDASMLGDGVGFDTKGAKQITVKGLQDKPSETYVIPDTREGWVESVGKLIDAFFSGNAPIEFDYSLVRGAGEPIRGFGGVSSGPEPLKDLHWNIINVLEPLTDKEITVRAIVDIMNFIGKAVVAGNVRRTAEIAIGEPFDEDYLNLKNYEINPERAEHGWTSNNSIYAELGMDYTKAADRTWHNGEPGYIWLENIQGYSRIKNGRDNKDHRAKGVNPCVEQSLESYELCNLVETFPMRHESLEDYLKTLKYAYLYSKTVTLGQTHWPETNRVMLRNRRIGCSISGVVQFITENGIDVFRDWCESGYDTIQDYDKIYSEWFAIPLSIKTTSVKPSGTVSLLAGATPGVHYPESRFYIRRMRLSKNSKLVKPLKKAGYNIEDAFGDPNSLVVDFPVDVGEGIRTVNEVSMWEQLSLAAFMQKHWADNQVSCTVTFDPDKEGADIANALNYFQYQLKGISFLPKMNGGAYPQMPYEEITAEEYKEKLKKLKKLDFTKVEQHEAVVDRFCSSDYCELKTEMEEIKEGVGNEIENQEIT
jgi:adenosylcobalamin-dependent ribonucleoside-triphosphate reductase